MTHETRSTLRLLRPWARTLASRRAAWVVVVEAAGRRHVVLVAVR